MFLKEKVIGAGIATVPLIRMWLLARVLLGRKSINVHRADAWLLAEFSKNSKSLR